MLTEEGEIVLDPFAGSNTTGATAENLNRQWLAIEAVREYLKQVDFGSIASIKAIQRKVKLFPPRRDF